MNENLESLRQKAWRFFQNENWDELILICTKIIELEKLPKASIYHYRGLAYHKKGGFDLAIEDFNKALELNPNNVETYHCRGLAYHKKGGFDLAIEDFNKALELNPNNVETYHCRGVTYYSKGDFDRAIEDFSKALKLNPDNVGKTYHYRGLAYHKKGVFDLAIEDFNKALELNPNNVETYHCRGVTYYSKGDFDRAIEDFSKALKLNPDNVGKTYHYRGLAYHKKGGFDLAIEDFNKALELNPDNMMSYTSRGVAYCGKGDFDRAIEDFSKALKLNPKNVMSYDSRGVAYYCKGNFDRAIEDFNKALELNPDHAYTYFFRGFIYNDKKDYDQAIADLSKTLELKPVDMLRARAHLLRGKIYLLGEDLLNAFDDFVDSNKYNPDLKFIYPQNYVASQIADIYKGSKEEDKTKAFKLYLKLLDSIIKIQRKQFYKPEEGKEVTHYTSLSTLKNLANKERFRFYNAAYMNDPEEGSVFFDIIKKKEPETNVKEVFYEEDEDPPYPSPAYIGSFIMVNSDDQEQRDKLFLWRTYGKHSGQEAAGACLIFRHEGALFAKTYEPQVGYMQRLQSKLPMLTGDLKDPGERQHFKPPLYKISYMDKGNNKELSEELDELAESLKQVERHVSEREDDIKNRLKRLARELLDNIRFLFKASHYKEEQEVRVVQLYYYDENMLQEQDEIKVDTEQIPPRFYLDAHSSFRFDKVVLGPKAHAVREWTQWLKERERGIKAKKSEIKYGTQSF